VYVEPTAAMTRLTSSTGTVLSIQRRPVAGNVGVPAMIVPRAACEHAVSLKIEHLTIEPAESGFSIGGAGPGRYLFHPVDGQFPDFAGSCRRRRAASRRTSFRNS